ncbi:hypothetical protein SAMN05216241_10698 [Limimonas halophila]|uniref:Curlin associated repeat-containing protein n=1 Tax=Limimonas halophila TaxID=1082479 RepID=A0A1G7S4Z1_9PROT|nr:hypothetical protein [Limimonas halophila]SDG17250.1 hypothetical protein SAMN05216241_10698 [Limimonas halophila]
MLRRILVTTAVTVTAGSLAFGLGAAPAAADGNDLSVRQIGEDNTARVHQGALSEAKTFVGDFFDGTFLQPVLQVETPAGEVVEQPIPANPRACEVSPVIFCEEVDLPGGSIEIPPGDADTSRARVIQRGKGNTAVARQYGDGSRSVLVQGSVSALEATNLAGIPRDFSFAFADAPAQTPPNGQDNTGNQGQGQGRGQGNGGDPTALGPAGFEPLRGEQTLDDILNSLNGQGAGRNNTAHLLQGGGGNRSVALQAGRNNRLLTVQNGNDVGVHLQTDDNNNTRLLQGDGANENALIARGDVRVAGQPNTPFTLAAQGGVNFAVDVKGPQSFSGFSARPNGTGGLDITARR